MSISVVTIPVDMRAVHESIVEFIKMLKFFCQKHIFYPKISEDEQTINTLHSGCVVHIGIHVVCDYDEHILYSLEIRSNVKVLKVTYMLKFFA